MNRSCSVVDLSSDIVGRIKVWIVEGDRMRIVFSDEPRIEGETQPLDPGLSRRLDRGEIVTMSVPDDHEHRFEIASSEHLIEAFVPFTDAAGNRVRLEIYVPVDVAGASRHSMAAFLPILLGGLLGFAIVTVPLSVALARRMERDQQERQDAVRYGLTASERERQEIARQLHDGVIQDLAGAGMLLDAMRLTERDDPRRDGELLDTAHRLLEDDIRQLRGLASGLLPTVAGADLPSALADLATRLGPADNGTRIDVDVAVDSRRGPDLDVASLLYRVAAELLRNAVRHSRAEHVALRVAADVGGVVMTVSDDGLGFDVRRAPPPGHIGLTLVRRAVEEIGGHLDVSSADGEGSTVTVTVPRRRRSAATVPMRPGSPIGR